MKVATERSDIAWLQANGFIAASQVDIFWEQLSIRCPPLEGGSSNYQQSASDELGSLPSIDGKFSKEKEFDFTIAFSFKNGDQLANVVVEQLRKRGYKAQKLQEPTEVFDPYVAEKKIASSISLVVLLTSNCLRSREVVFPLLVAKQYFDHPSLAILVHDASSCLFPGYDEQPEQVKEFFSEKAVTFLSCYVAEGIDEIASKYENERAVLVNTEKNRKENPEAFLQALLLKYKDKDSVSLDTLREETKSILDEAKFQEFIASTDKDKSGSLELPELVAQLEQKNKKPTTNDNAEEHEDLTTTLFLSHKRSTGQGIAGRLYEGLKDWYTIFIDSEAKFKIHDLKQIVESTSVFVFILSYGILLSKWCLEEFKSAIANKKKVVVVRELSFTVPEHLPPEWQEYEHILRSEDQLIWIAEYNAACVAALKRIVGLRDDAKKEMDKFDANGPVIQQAVNQVKQTGILDLTQLHKSSPLLALVSADTLIHTIGTSAGFDSIKILKVGSNLTIQQFDFISLWLPHLEEIQVDDISDKAVERLAQRCHSLKSFVLTRGSDKFTDAAFIHLGHFTNLEVLKLPTVKILSHLTDNSMKNLSKGSIRNLKILDIAGYPFKKSLPLLYLAFPNIASLAVSKWNFKDEDVVEPLNKLTNLKRLDLSGNPGITDATLLLVSQKCPNLEYLDITECTFTRKGLEALTDGCQNIKELHGAKELNDLILKFPNLEAVYGNAILWNFFTREPVLEIGKACPKLKVLHIGGTTVDIPIWIEFQTLYPHISLKYQLQIYSMGVKEDVLENMPPPETKLKTLKNTEAKTIIQGPEIGKGNFAPVYKAKWRSTTVALKHEQAKAPRESTILSCLMPHPNLALFFGIIQGENSEPYGIVMEYCENGSLDNYLQNHKDISNSSLTNIAKGVASGLAHIHSEKIVHCDIAARNIVLTPGLDPKIVDFGLAVYLGDQKEVYVQNRAPGAIKWMPPEWFNSVVSSKLDVWSFGILLIEILTGGKMSHENISNEEVSPLIQNEGFHPEIPGNVSKEAKYILEQCFQKDPANRITMADIVAVLSNTNSLVA